MQSLMLQHWPAVIWSNVTRILCVVMPILTSMLCGCVTAEKTYRFSARSVTKVIYNPKRCTERPDGRFQCKDVIFTVSSIEAEK